MPTSPKVASGRSVTTFARLVLQKSMYPNSGFFAVPVASGWRPHPPGADITAAACADGGACAAGGGGGDSVDKKPNSPTPNGKAAAAVFGAGPGRAANAGAGAGAGTGAFAWSRFAASLQFACEAPHSMQNRELGGKMVAHAWQRGGCRRPQWQQNLAPEGRSVEQAVHRSIWRRLVEVPPVHRSIWRRLVEVPPAHRSMRREGHLPSRGW